LRWTPCPPGYCNSPASEKLLPLSDMAPLIRAPEGLEPSRTTRCSAHTTPAADFCGRIRVNYFTLSRESATCRRSPVISSTAFDTRPPDLPPVLLMDTDFAISGPLVRRRRPRIQFLSIGPYLCSTLPLDTASRWCPCASLPFTSHQVGAGLSPASCRTCTAYRKKGRRTARRPFFVFLVNRKLEGLYVGGLQSFRTLGHFEFNRLAIV